MKIARVHATPLRVPRLFATVSSLGSVSESDFGVVRIETDEGIVGWGEVTMSWGRAGRALCNDVNQVLAPLIVGLDAMDIPKCNAAIANRLATVQDGAHAAIAGIEMALLDIIGKVANVPVYQLLGGRARDSVPVCAPVPFGEPDDAAEAAIAAVEAGYRTLKVKVGHPGEVDRQILKAVRSAVGAEINIKVDANTAYRSAGEAYAALAPLLEFGLQLVEQPLPQRDLDELSRLREKLPVPLLLDESCWDLRDIGEIVRRGAADALNIYVSEMGGPLQAYKGFAAAEAAGLDALLGSQLELGLGTVAGWHVGIAVANLAYESDIVGFTRYARDIIFGGLAVEAGRLLGPTAPGLGVEVDEDALAYYSW